MSTQKPQFKIIKDGDERTFEDRDEWQDMKDLLDENGVDYQAEGPDEDTEATDDSGASNTDESGFTVDQERVVPGQDDIMHCAECGRDREHYLYHSGEWVCGDCGTAVDASDPSIPSDDNPADKEPEVMTNGGSENGIDHPTQVVDDDEPDVVDTTTAEPVDPEDLSSDPIGFLQDVNDDFVNVIKGKPAISKQGFRFIQREFEISTESEVVQWTDDPLGCIVWAKAELPNGYSAEAHGEGYQFEHDVSDNEFVRYADTRAKNRAISDLTSAGALAVSELSENND
jgi:hypothetical protein